MGSLIAPARAWYAPMDEPPLPVCVPHVCLHHFQVPMLSTCPGPGEASSPSWPRHQWLIPGDSPCLKRREQGGFVPSASLQHAGVVGGFFQGYSGTYPPPLPPSPFCLPSASLPAWAQDG